MVFDPKEKARKERVRYHKNKQEYLNNGGVMPSDEKRRKSKEELDSFILPSKKTISTIPMENPFKFPIYEPIKPKPVYNKNGLQKKKGDEEYEDVVDNKPKNPYANIKFY